MVAAAAGVASEGGEEVAMTLAIRGGRAAWRRGGGPLLEVLGGDESQHMSSVEVLGRGEGLERDARTNTHDEELLARRTAS